MLWALNWAVSMPALLIATNSHLVKYEIKEDGESIEPPGHLTSPRTWPGRLVFSIPEMAKTMSPSTTW